MTAVGPGIYFGSVIHSRLRPKKHRLRYRAFWLLVDIDTIDELASGLRLLSRDRFNLFSIHDRDYGDELKARSASRSTARCTRLAKKSARTACFFSLCRAVLGYVFNPLSVFFCYAVDGRLAAIIYEVHNTFGGRHKYVLSVDQAAARTVQQECDKTFVVSPFMAMDVRYSFEVSPPEERVSIAVKARDEGGPIINTALSGEREHLSDAWLLRAFFSIPLLTLKVTLAIHWEALRMWLKGFRRLPSPGVSRRWRLPRGRGSDSMTASKTLFANPSIARGAQSSVAVRMLRVVLRGIEHGRILVRTPSGEVIEVSGARPGPEAT